MVRFLEMVLGRLNFKKNLQSQFLEKFYSLLICQFTTTKYLDIYKKPKGQVGNGFEDLKSVKFPLDRVRQNINPMIGPKRT